jgi:hypothetical protein
MGQAVLLSGSWKLEDFLMATRKRRSGAGRKPSWVPPQGCPAQFIEHGETRLAYQLFAMFWLEWQTSSVDDELARQQSSFSAAEKLYIELRPDSKNTNFVMRQFRDFGWSARCAGRVFQPTVKPRIKAAPPPEAAAATPLPTPAKIPDNLRSLLQIGTRSLQLEIAQLAKLQEGIDRALSEDSTTGLHLDSTGLESVDVLVSLINAAKRMLTK